MRNQIYLLVLILLSFSCVTNHPTQVANPGKISIVDVKPTDTSVKKVTDQTIEPSIQKADNSKVVHVEEKASFWGYMAVYKPNYVLEELKESAFVESLKQIGLSFKEMNPKVPFVLFAWEPKAGAISFRDWKSLPIAFFLPITPFSKSDLWVKEKAKKIFPEAQWIEINKDGMVLTLNQRSQLLVKKDQILIEKTLANLIQRESVDSLDSVLLHLEVAAIFGALEEPIKNLLVGEDNKIGPTGKYLKEKWSHFPMKQRIQKYQTPEVRTFLSDLLVSWISHLQSIDIKVRFINEVVQLQLELKRKQEFLFGEEKKSPQNIVSWLPTSSMIRFQILFDYVGELFSGEGDSLVMPGFLSSVFEKDNPELSEKLEEIWNKLTQQFKNMMVSVSIDPMTNHKAFFILAPKDSASFMRATQDFIDLFRKISRYQNHLQINQKANFSSVFLKGNDSLEWSIEVFRKDNLIYVRLGSDTKSMEQMVKTIMSNQGKNEKPIWEKESSFSLSLGAIHMKTLIDFLIGEHQLKSIMKDDDTVSWLANIEEMKEMISIHFPRRVLDLILSKIHTTK